MKIGKLTLSVFAMSALGTFNAQAMPIDVDLNVGWTAEGTAPGFNWIVDGDGAGVLQTINGFPTVFHNNSANSQDRQLSGSIQVLPDPVFQDNDSIGFVLGYNANDLFNPNPDYLVIDWRGGTQTFSPGCDDPAGTPNPSPVGLSIKRVTAPQINFGQLSCNTGIGGVTELARGATLGNVGWVAGDLNIFDLIFTDSAVQVLVNGNLELNIAGTFSDGGFGFYNSSQALVRYAGIVEDDAVLVPEPGTLALFSIGLLGMGLSRRRKKD